MRKSELREMFELSRKKNVAFEAADMKICGLNIYEYLYKVVEQKGPDVIERFLNEVNSRSSINNEELMCLVMDIQKLDRNMWKNEN
jgi:hypothetical protein